MPQRRAQSDENQTAQMGLSPVQNRLLYAAAELKESPDAVERAYMARQLVQCTLPHSDPGNVPSWSRTNGNLQLSIRPMYDEAKERYLYPYGVLPRLVLIWICSEAVKRKSRRLTLGTSFSEFMRELDLNPANGGQRSDAKRLRNQLVRLLNAQIALKQTQYDGKATGVTSLYMQVSDLNELWWSPSEATQDNLWESWLELGERFYQAITAAPVPVDMRALRGLRNSPLALDLYTFLTYRTHVANKHRETQFVPWDGLFHQMGAGYAELRQFKAKATAALRRIRQVSRMKVSDTANGLQISPAPTSVPPKGRVLDASQTI